MIAHPPDYHHGIYHHGYCFGWFVSDLSCSWFRVMLLDLLLICNDFGWLVMILVDFLLILFDFVWFWFIFQIFLDFIWFSLISADFLWFVLIFIWFWLMFDWCWFILGDFARLQNKPSCQTPSWWPPPPALPSWRALGLFSKSWSPTWSAPRGHDHHWETHVWPLGPLGMNKIQES